MIEQALRKRLQPTVNRRRRLYLALWLSICWFVAILIGTGLIVAYWLLGWKSTVANWALCITSGLATLLILHQSLRLRLDYKAVARDIERKHPELKALLLTAIEQEPDQPGGSLSYLQERVIGEAVRHAVKYDWLRSVSSTKLALAQICWFVTLALLIAAFSQLLPSRPFLLRTGGNVLARKGYQITVTPGDTRVEAGSPVVILARFDGRLPRDATLVYETLGEKSQQIPLTKNMEDPVFGGIIQEVNSNLLYRIEYANQSTRDYSISVYKHPALTRADAKIVYPAYTKLPEKVIQDTRRVSAIEGSQINLTFTLNKAVTTAQLIPKEGSALDLTVDSEHPNIYTTSITATDNRRYELNLVDAQGLKNEIPQRFTIDVHKNLPSEIKPVFPNRDVVASPLEELSLEAEVSDDYGVTHYGLSYTLAGAQSADITLSSLEERQEKQMIQHLLALENLDARPDQLLTYYFWADDVGPNGNSRRTVSDMYFAEVRHFEEIFRESESSQNQNQQNQQSQQQGQQGGQLAQLQKQIISATWNIKRQADQLGGLYSQKEDLNVVRQSQADVLEQAQSTLAQTQEVPAIQALQAATQHMETSLDHLTEAGGSLSTEELMPALAAEQSAYQELLKLRDREHQVTQSRSANARNAPRSARSERQLQQLELRQRENRYETERLAQSQEQTMQREDLQVHNRLRDLARRQSEMSEKLKEAETALRQAQNDQEREEIRRELKRLRDEQLEALRDVDELQERMERSENRQRMADTRQQLDQSRSRIRQSAEELERGMVSRAITSTTRAQRELEQMRDQFRRNTSSQFSEQMRQMREQAQQLDERQKEIANEMQGQRGSEQKTLRDSSDTQNLADRMDQQKESMENLIEQMKDVSEKAEIPEPLLSRKLYETVRETSTKNLDRDLEVAGELIRRNFLPQAQEIEKRAGQGIEELRKDVEEAAESVLGDEAEALRLAREQLDELIREVNDEVARANASGQQDGDPNGRGDQMSNQQQRADAQRGTGRGQEGDPNEPGNMQANQQRQGNAQRGAGRGQGGDPNEMQERQANQRRLADGRTGSRQRQFGDRRPGGRVDPRGWGDNQGAFGPWEQVDPNGPLTGRDFRQWSDRLRDVEEMLNESEMRAEAARVRDRARAIRAEFTRHGKEPQWDLVRQMITKPLAELRDRISEELSSLESDEAMVPIDRDPVPGRFADLVRRYYENLGDQK